MKIVVYGQPAPQGSKRYVGRKGGKGVMIESSEAVKPWREAVKQAALDQRVTQIGWPFDGPLYVSMVFTLKRPKAAKKGESPKRKPDLSKLIRSTEDALTDAGIWTDDARVVAYSCRKVYPDMTSDALGSPGAVIVIKDWRDT